jgi:hypothetical protein
MGRAIVVGHGGFNEKSELYLVPPNTTITFLADAGSVLNLPAVVTGPQGSGWKEGVNWDFDYEQVTEVLDEFLEAEKPLVAGKVVPNMFTEALGARSAEVAQRLQDAGKWGAEKFKNTPASLCTGTADKCPTPALNAAQLCHDAIAKKGEEAVVAFKSYVEAGATGSRPEVLKEFSERLDGIPRDYYQFVVDGVPEARWKHDCAGLLTEFAGCDIVWVSCSGFAVDQDTLDRLELPQGLPPEMTARTHGPRTGQADGVLLPLPDAELNGMRTLRKAKFDETPLGKSISIRASEALVVLGSDYAGNIESHIKRQDDLQEGTVTKKANPFGKLKSLEIQGISPARQQRVRGVMGALAPDIEVNFT